jgi:predicted nucleic acid-binding protein
MLYIDTNILIYFIYQTQDVNKFLISERLIEKSISINNLFISPLILQEFIYASFKIDKNKERIKDGFNLFKKYCKSEITKELLIESFELAEKLNYFQKINDCIHIKFAERHCDKLVTFDKDFEKFRQHTKLEIEILN